MVKTSPLLGGEAKGSFTRAALAGVSCLALLCLALSARSLSTQTELADVAVDGTSFPSYYGGQSLANPAVSYPDMNIAGAGSLAAAPSFNVAPGQKLDDMCGGGTAAVTLCSSFLPAAGVAAAPYMTPSLSSWGGGCGQGPCGGGAGSNTYQAPTVWNGDHVLGGGQPEWATEDAAQHALNLANWRIKLLQAKLEQAKLASRVMNAKLASRVMNVGDAQTHYLQAQAGSAQKQVASPEQVLHLKPYPT
ncbi:hypothetical protein T484DRAFT_1788973 [Baffinella frigidus]|nr:hypothetical protein T484DRAFT_1788973 [Cryptophyta sp. CCMP2293]